MGLEGIYYDQKHRKILVGLKKDPTSAQMVLLTRPSAV